MKPSAGDEIASRVSELAPVFLRGLAPKECTAVLAAATQRRLPANSVITREAHRAYELFLFLDGRARYFSLTREGEKVILGWIRPGEIAGGAALLKGPMDYVLSTETMMESSALVWKHDALLSLGRRSPKLIENMLSISWDYLITYRDLHIAASYDNADKRLAFVLEKLTKRIGQKVDGGIELTISNEELANEANVTIFTVSRLLSEWRRKGLLVKGRGRIVLRSPEKLPV